ncbi:ROK family transcriptional regulator [Alicyclobacillus curvatus]|nr:ROK family transcriptional regulator [Alicyclobacillus curvatus]
MEGANSVVLRDLNMNSIFRLIQHRGPISRVDIAEQTGLAASTVSVITGELQGSGFIRECGYATSTGGRRPRLLEINPQGGYFICADLTGSNIAIGVLDLSFQVLKEWFHEKTNMSGQSLYVELVKALSEARAWCNTKGFSTLSIGIAAPGLMDSMTGRIVSATNLDWHDLDLNELLEQEFGLPVIVENDTNAAAYGEFLYGVEHEENAENMLYVAVGTGVGAGLIVHRSLYTGSSGMAGELGHIVVKAGGDRCNCGKRGCLETFVSEPAMLQRYVRLTEEQGNKQDSSVGDSASVTIQGLARRAESGDGVAIDVLHDAGRMLGTVAGNTVNVLNCDSVVFGGEAVTGSKVMLAAITEGLYEAMLPGFERNLKVRVSSLNSTAAYVGVAYASLTTVLNKYGFQVSR